MTTTPPEPPPDRDDGPDTADDRFDRRIAFLVVAGLAVVAAVGPFGWHLLSNNNGSSKAAGVSALATNGGNGGNGGNNSNGIAAIVNPAAAASTTAPNSPATTSPSPGASPTSTAAAGASCAAALADAKAVSASGAVSSIGGWAVMATPRVNALRANAASLHGITVQQDAAAVPAAAKGLCDEVGSVGQLAPMPDAVGATAWQAALSAYVAGATDALAAAGNRPAYYQAAQAQLAQGEQELDALSARIIATTRHRPSQH